jgi:hypothetical protein
VLKLTILNSRRAGPDRWTPFLKVVGEELGAAHLVLNGKTSTFNPNTSLPLARPWVIFGEPMNLASSPPVLLSDGRSPISEDEFNYFLEIVGERHTWTLIPWGAFESFDLLTFITDQLKYQTFIEKAISKTGSVDVLSRIEGSNEFVKSGRGIIYFEDHEAKANGIWEQAEASGSLPHVLYAPVVELDPYDAPRVRVAESALLDLKPEAVFRDKYTRNETLYPLAFVLYSATSRQVLQALCRGSGKRLMVFGGKCTLDALKSVFSPERSFYEEELTLLLQISSIAGWAYGVNCGGVDWPVDVFVSNEPLITQRLRSFLDAQYRPFRLTSFF